MYISESHICGNSAEKWLEETLRNCEFNFHEGGMNFLKGNPYETMGREYCYCVYLLQPILQLLNIIWPSYIIGPDNA